MATFRYHRPTDFDLSPSTHEQTTPSRRRRVIDPAVDPGLYTPSKRMRLLTTSLASTASGTYLVDKTPMTASQASLLITGPVLERPLPLPEPDWSLLDLRMDEACDTRPEMMSTMDELTESLCLAKQQIRARDLVIEGAQAQLVVQSMTLKKMKESMEAKEKKKKTNRTTLFPGGKGVVLTDPEIVKLLEDKRQSKEDEEEGRKQRQMDRAGKKAEREKLEERWQEMKATHERAVEKWEEGCVRLTMAGTIKKDLPKRPVRPLKPKPAPAATSSAVRVEDLEEEPQEGSEEDDDEFEA
ncbi:hypothetical protein FPV67DRAFT_1431310 [Lyophyllum atratum]|nr:hypothetical protein FPV67DRAFT_1431310 [Lyophyllum atratum]